MIRETFADKYNEEVRLIICELFNICILTLKHSGGWYASKTVIS